MSNNPQAPAFPVWEGVAASTADIVIVGGGFSGFTMLLRLLTLLPRRRIVVVERQPRPAPGLAYGACDASHLLNVSAGWMGALAEDPGGFYRWLAEQLPGRYAASDFVPRALFGEYLLALMRQSVAATTASVSFVHDTVRDVSPEIENKASALRLYLRSGATLVANAVVLACGLPAGSPPWSAGLQAALGVRLLADPWQTQLLAAPDRNADLLILGSGLTAIDIVQRFRRAGHSGIMHLVSRKGRLPLPHAAPVTNPPQSHAASLSGSPRAVFATLRVAIGDHSNAGRSWQIALDAFRPQVTAIWQRWSVSERALFLRHLRPLWEIHRHRAPQQALVDINMQIAVGQLTLQRGSLLAVRADGDRSLEITLRTPTGPRQLPAIARVVNCTGPSANVAETIDPLLRSLLESDIASTDELGLGLRADASGRLLNANGAANPQLFLVGALRRAQLWEATAVPELRLQVETAARALIKSIQSAAPSDSG